MPQEKRRPVLPKIKKRKAEEISDDEGEKPQVWPAKGLIDRKFRPVLGNVKNKSSHASGHNCPCKDSGSTHAFNATVCFRKSHAGYCPGCDHVVSWVKGCPRNCTMKNDKIKGSNLMERPLAAWEKPQYHKDHSIVPGLAPGQLNNDMNTSMKRGVKDNKAGNQNKKIRVK